MPQPADLPTPLKTARRKLIRGAIAAPALITLQSGSAFAAASNVRCISNNAHASAPAIMDKQGTSWFRVPVYKVNNSGYYVRKADLTQFGNRSHLSASQTYYRLDNTANYVLHGNQTHPAGNATSRGTYVLIRFDKNGYIINFGGHSTSHPLSQSCWTSFITSSS